MQNADGLPCLIICDNCHAQSRLNATSEPSTVDSSDNNYTEYDDINSNIPGMANISEYDKYGQPQIQRGILCRGISGKITTKHDQFQMIVKVRNFKYTY